MQKVGSNEKLSGFVSQVVKSQAGAILRLVKAFLEQSLL